MKRSILSLFIPLIFIFTILASSQISCTKPLEIREEKIEAGDVTLFVRIVGNPTRSEVLITLNGGPGQSSHYMKSIEQLAGPKLAVVSFDQRGTGRSSKGTEGYAFEKYMADIEAVRQNLKVETLLLYGHSFGGVLALRYASLYPDRVSGLILMGSGPPRLEAIPPAQMRLGQRLQQLVREGILSDQRPSTPDRMILYMLPAYFSDPEFPVPDEIKQTSFHPSVSQKTLTDSGNWDFRPDMKAITCPVLFLWGEDDPFGTELADETRKALVNAKLTDITLKKCGHFWQENAVDFFAHIRTFLLHRFTSEPEIRP